MKRIAIFTRGGVSFPKSVGHVPALEALFSRLAEKNDVTIFTTSPYDEAAGTFTCGKATVHQIQACYDDSIIKKLRAYLISFRRDHARKPFDLLHGFWALPGGFFAVTLGRITRIPNVVTLLGAEAAAVREINYGQLLRSRTRIPLLWTCRSATALTTMTQFQEQELRRYGLRRPDIRTIPIGVDTTIFHRSRSKPVFPPLNLLHVANLTGVKDQETLLNAFRLIGNRIETKLRIIGPDYVNGKIHDTAKTLRVSDKVEFRGRLENTMLAEHYSWAHLLLHTSYYEGQGMVVAEAAACGTVTCGTRVGLVADLEDKCTLAVDVGDHEGLAKKVIDLLNDGSRLKQLEQNSLDWARAHDLEWTVGQYEELYNELLSMR